MNDRFQVLEQPQPRSASTAGVEEEKTGWQRQGASTDGVTHNTPSSGTHGLHPRPGEEQHYTGHEEEELDSVSASRPVPSDQDEGLCPGGESIREGIDDEGNIRVEINQALPRTLPKIEGENATTRESECSMDEKEGTTIVRPHDWSKMPAGQMKSPARSTALAQYLAVVQVPPALRSYTSNDPHTSSFGTQTEVTLCPSNSAEVRFPPMGSVGSIVGGFCSADGSKGNGGASFDARDCEPLGVTSHVEDLAYDEGGIFGEKSECSPERGTKSHPKRSSWARLQSKRKQTASLRRHQERYFRSFHDTTRQKRRRMRTSVLIQGAYTVLLLSPLLFSKRAVLKLLAKQADSQQDCAITSVVAELEHHS